MNWQEDNLLHLVGLMTTSRACLHCYVQIKLSLQLGCNVPWHYSVHLRKGRAELSQCPLVQWASGHWHYERTLHSRRPLARDRRFYLSIRSFMFILSKEMSQIKASSHYSLSANACISNICCTITYKHQYKAKGHMSPPPSMTSR